MNKFVKSLLLTSTVVALAACTNNTSTKQTETSQNTEVTQTTNQYVNNSTFIINKDGKAIKSSEVTEDMTVIDWYVDPYCKYCTKLEDLMKPELKKLMAEKNVVIRYHVLTFLSAKTVDDYSNRAAGYILSAIEVSPELAYDYFTAILTDSFKPVSEAKADDKFKEVYLSIGGTEANWKIIESKKDEFTEQAKKATSEAFNDEKLIAKSEEGALYVPFLIIGDSEKALNFTGETDTVEFIKQKISEYQEKNKQTTTTESTSSEG